VKAALLRYLDLLRQGVRAAAQWRLLLWWVAITAIPALLVALPLVAALDGQLDHALQAADLAREQNPLLMLELVHLLRGAGMALAGSGALAGVLLLLLAPLLNAMFIAAARAPAPPGLGDLLRGASANYWRMLRLGLFALVPLGIAAGVAALLMKGVQHYSEHAILEADVTHLRWLALAGGAALYAWASAGVDAARAWLALHPSAGDAGMLGGFLLTQAIVAITAWMHYARQFAMAAWWREVLPTS